MTTTLIISDNQGGIGETRTYCCDKHAQSDPEYPYAWKQVGEGFGCPNTKPVILARSYPLTTAMQSRRRGCR